MKSNNIALTYDELDSTTELYFSDFNRIVERKSDQRGWMVGHFISPHTHPFSTESFEIKWGVHKKGKSHHTVAKKNNFSKTIEVLISGHSRIYFPDQNTTVSLNKPGQFVYWKEGVYHITEYLKDTTVLIIRWPSTPDDQEERDEL